MYVGLIAFLLVWLGDSENVTIITILQKHEIIRLNSNERNKNGIGTYICMYICD